MTPTLPDNLPEPTWSDPEYGVALYCGDCLEILPQLPKARMDAVVTDPPYGINHSCNYKSRGRGRRAQCNDYSPVVGDAQPFDPSPLLRLGLPTILWGANHFGDRLPPSSGWLVWDKERPDDLDQATCELAWSNCVKGVRRFRHLWHGFARASEHGENYHATQKPVALLQWCLSLRWTTGLRSVLDPFMGSGPTGVACVNLSRAFIGIEIERAYFDVAVTRIQKAIIERQGGPLFAKHTPPKQENLSNSDLLPYAADLKNQPPQSWWDDEANPFEAERAEGDG